MKSHERSSTGTRDLRGPYRCRLHFEIQIVLNPTYTGLQATQAESAEAGLLSCFPEEVLLLSSPAIAIVYTQLLLEHYWLRYRPFSRAWTVKYTLEFKMK